MFQIRFSLDLFIDYLMSLSVVLSASSNYKHTDLSTAGTAYLYTCSPLNPVTKYWTMTLLCSCWCWPVEGSVPVWSYQRNKTLLASITHLQLLSTRVNKQTLRTCAYSLFNNNTSANIYSEIQSDWIKHCLHIFIDIHMFYTKRESSVFMKMYVQI